VLIRSEAAGREVTVRVENDAATHGTPNVTGTGRGLIGLRERVLAPGGTFSAGPTSTGGCAVEAQLAGTIQAMIASRPPTNEFDARARLRPAKTKTPRASTTRVPLH
jgi:hypothetical protein